MRIDAHKMFSFNKKYFSAFLFLLLTEILIAVYVHDNFIRPYVGDVLVVILLYCFVNAFVKVKPIIAAIAVLTFSFMIEFLQYLNIVEKMGLEQSTLAKTIIGTSFSWSDLVAYTTGFLLIWFFDIYRKRTAAQNNRH